jgi:hypothetical protein
VHVESNPANTPIFVSRRCADYSRRVACKD